MLSGMTHCDSPARQACNRVTAGVQHRWSAIASVVDLDSVPNLLQTITFLSFLQGWLKKLQLPPGLNQHAPAPAYAALSALCAYLKRMKADQELATGASHASAVCPDIISL